VQTVEIGTGGAPGNAHLDPVAALENPKIFDDLQAALDKNKLSISAFSVHGNPVHPNKELADKDHLDFVNSCKAAQKMGVDTIITFSGCPGDYEGAKYPNWVTCAWPTDYLEVLKYQWDEVLVPYWKKASAIAAEYGVTKIALEMHPGFCVYNPRTLLQLREAVGPAIGANFDPSHLFWQGADPVYAIRKLGPAIYHFHAKDTKIDPINTATNGVLDIKPYGDEINRSWVFRTVGYGNGDSVWKDIISNLRLVGYDGVISIEHEDSLMTSNEGLEKAIEFLSGVLMFEDKGEMFWA
jgi:sugar phosphate isomerase/epimerase